MKKTVSLLITFALFFCMINLNTYAEEKELYISSPIEYSDKIGTIEKLDLLLKDGNVYARAETLASRLGCSCNIGESGIVLKSIDSDKMPYINVIFSSEDTTVRKSINTLFIETFEAPFASVINEKGAWIPLEYTMLILNGGLMIIDDILLIDLPKPCIIDCFTTIAKKSNEYSFEWNKDFGYTESDQAVMGITSHMVNVFNGILDFDGYSWAQFFTTFGFSSAGYDAKYGRNLALLLCTESDNELKASIEKTNLILDIFDGDDGHLGKALKSYSKETDKTVETLYNQCNSFLEDIKKGNKNAVKNYNYTYRQFEKAFDKQTWFSNTGGKIMDVHDGLSSATNALDAISKIAEAVSYSQEFNNQDKFSINSLNEYLKTADTNSDLSKTMKNSMYDYLAASTSEIEMYGAYRYFNEHVGELVESGLTLGEVLASDANIALFCWNISSGLIPFISNGLDASDKYELALYAQVFQGNAHMNYVNKRIKTFNDADSISPENLYTLSQYLYTYLKSCYITRNAALGSLNGKSNSTKEQLQPLIDNQNKINQEIVQILNIVKNANETNDNQVYGFLPQDNKKYLDDYDSSSLQTFVEVQHKNNAKNNSAFVCNKYIVEYNDVVYGVDQNGLWKNEGGFNKEYLTKHSATNIATDGQTIYYGVFNKSVNYYPYSSSSPVASYQYDMYAYDLLSETDKKIMSFVECGKPICAIGDTIYYTDYPDNFDGDMVERAHGLCSYNINTHEKKYITDGANLVESYNGKIFYRDIMAAMGNTQTHQIYCYDTSTGKTDMISDGGVMDFKIHSGKLFYNIFTEDYQNNITTSTIKLYSYDISSGDNKLLYSKTGNSLTVKDYDNKYLIYSEKRIDGDGYIQVELDSGNEKTIPPSSFEGDFPSQAMRVNGKTIFYTNYSGGRVYTLEDGSTTISNTISSYTWQTLLAVKGETEFSVTKDSENFYRYYISCGRLS